MPARIHEDWTEGDRQERELRPYLKAQTDALEDARPSLSDLFVVADSGWQQASTALDEPGQIAAEGAAVYRRQLADRMAEL